MGSIGKEVAKRAKAFGMYILVYSGHTFSREEEMEYGVEYVSSIEDIAKKSDVISVHIPLSKETKNILGTQFFDCMKEGSYFINTSRGGVVDDDALEKAIKEKGIRAGLDVWNNQPSKSQDEFHNKIAKMDNVYGTHHIGASTDFFP
jgi:D-3-phosphoglycerate dehydrogenase